MTMKMKGLMFNETPAQKLNGIGCSVLSEYIYIYIYIYIHTSTQLFNKNITKMMKSEVSYIETQTYIHT